MGKSERDRALAWVDRMSAEIRPERWYDETEDELERARKGPPVLCLYVEDVLKALAMHHFEGIFTGVSVEVVEEILRRIKYDNENAAHWRPQAIEGVRLLARTVAAEAIYELKTMKKESAGNGN